MRLPGDKHRHNIYGKTGSGKTVAGLWALEKRDWGPGGMPWIIVDQKRDEMIGAIPRLEEIGLDDRIPKDAGLYVVRPIPGEDDKLADFFWRVWERTHIGLFIDEAARIKFKNSAYDTICTQGRSLRIPIIQLSQRPSWLPKFAMSEADFHQAFFFQTPADIEKLEEWIPANLRSLKQDHHSFYYDVAKNDLTFLAPVPDEAEILQRFEDKVSRKIRLFSGLFELANKPKRALTV